MGVFICHLKNLIHSCNTSSNISIPHCNLVGFYQLYPIRDYSPNVRSTAFCSLSVKSHQCQLCGVSDHREAITRTTELGRLATLDEIFNTELIQRSFTGQQRAVKQN